MVWRPLIILALAALFISAFFWSSPSPKKHLEFSGNIETIEVALSFQVPGRIATRPLDEGDKAAIGQVAATLDPYEYEWEVKRKSAIARAAQNEVEELESGYEEKQVEEARFKLEGAKAQSAYQESDWKRNRDLFAEDAISEKERDFSSTSYKESLAKMQAEESHFQLLKGGYRKEKISQSKAKRDAAIADLAIAEYHLNQSVLTAPSAGVVLAKHKEPGEIVAKGTPVVTIGTIESVFLRGYIDEPDLGKIHLGQKVFLKTDSFPDKTYEGKITFISSEAEFTPRNIQTKKERVKTVWMIKVTLPNPEHELKPGMPADAWVELS